MTSPKSRGAAGAAPCAKPSPLGCRERAERDPAAFTPHYQWASGGTPQLRCSCRLLAERLRCETLPIRQACPGGSGWIAGSNEPLASDLIHACHGVGLDDFPQIVRHQAPASSEPMPFPVLGGTQTMSSVGVKPKVPVRFSALMANQSTATKRDRAISPETIRCSDYQGFTHRDLRNQGYA
jgi:hypothetical protein